MYKISLLFFIFCALGSFAQIKVTVLQTCGVKNITVFYKDGSEGATNEKVNDTTTIYNIPITEPVYLYIIIDPTTRYVERLWVDPQSHDRKIMIDNCHSKMIKFDSISIEKDDLHRVVLEDSLKFFHMSDDSFNKVIDNFKKEYIQKNKKSFLSTWYLSHIMYRIDIDTVKELRDLLGSNYASTQIFKSINNYIYNYKYKSVPKLGDEFFEFNAKKIDKIEFKSTDISGKVIILFFWYSSCGPCHKAMPALNHLYSEIHKQGLEIISYDCDDDEDKWIQASKEYNIPGINTSNLLGFSSPLFFHYNMNVFPSFVVFDKNKKLSLITFGEDEVPNVESKVRELLDIKQ